MLRASLTVTFFAAILFSCAQNGAIPGAASDQGESMVGFSWVVDDKLAGMPRPGSRRSLDDDMAFLKEQRIELLFSLTESAIVTESAAAHGIKAVHLPVKDFTAPTLEQIEEFVEKATAAIRGDRSVGVHCGAGKGRTGTFLAAYFVAEGMTPNDAIAEIRRLRPGSVETDEQEQVIAAYYESLRATREGPR